MIEHALDHSVAAKRASPAAQRLVLAMQALIAEGSVDSASVEELVARAGIAKRSFYNHFADRDALTRHVVDEACQALHVHLVGLQEGAPDPATRFMQATMGCIAHCSAERFREQVLARTVHDAKGRGVPGLAPLFDALVAGIEAGALRPVSFDAGKALLLGTCLMGSSHLQRLGNASDAARTLAHQMALLLLRGLRVDGRRQASLARQAVARAWPDGNRAAAA